MVNANYVDTSFLNIYDTQTLQDFLDDLWNRHFCSEVFFITTEYMMLLTPTEKTSRRLEQIRNTKKFVQLMRYNRRTDIYFSPNTFCPNGDINGNAAYNNLFAIYSIAIDVDYKKNGNKNSNPLNYYQDCIAELLPIQPNWIEYGHNLRLIYNLEEPIKAKLPSGKKLMAAVKQWQKRICSILNNELDCNAEPQKLNSYYRVPESCNSKDGSRIQYEKVNTCHYTIQEMMDELPPLPEYYETWKAKKSIIGSKKNNISKIYNSYQLWKDRQQSFYSLREEPNINREKLLFWFGISLLKTNEDINLQEQLLEFNQGFINPLPEKEIKSKIRTIQELYNTHHYKIKNTTLINELGIGEEVAERYGIGMTKRERERLEKIAAGQTRKQLYEARYQTYLSLRAEGLNAPQIAAQMGVSVDTVRDYSKRYNKENRQ